MKNITTAIVLTDLQVPYHDVRSLAAVEKYMAAHKWDYYLNLGDLMDFDCISSHNKNNLRAVEGKRILQDYEVANTILDRHQSIVRANNRSAKFVLLEGNHEERMERYIDANPQVEGMLEVENGLRLKERKIDWVRYWTKGETYQIGKAHFAHGGSTTQYHAGKMAGDYGENIFYGHTHDVMGIPKVLKGHDKTIVGQSLGCLCNYDLSYMKGRPSKWSQAVTTFHFLPNGFFNYYISLIFNHKFIGPDGILYEG